MDYGKSRFEDSQAERLHEISLEGGHDDEIGSVDELGWAGRFDDELTILTEDSQGFVWSDRYATRADLEAHWKELIDTYEELEYGLVV